MSDALLVVCDESRLTAAAKTTAIGLAVALAAVAAPAEVALAAAFQHRAGSAR